MPSTAWQKGQTNPLSGGLKLANDLELAKSPLTPEALQIFKQGKGLRDMSLALDQLGLVAHAIECAKATFDILEEIEYPRAENVRRKLQEWQS